MSKRLDAMKRASGDKPVKENSSSAGWMHNAMYGVPEDERGGAYYHSGLLPDTIDKMSNEAKQDYAKYEAVTVNEQLPKIQGVSQKQIDYAETIRSRAISSEIQRAHERVKKLSRDRLQAEFERAGAQSLSDYITKAMKMNPNSAYNKYKNITTAREILDNR